MDLITFLWSALVIESLLLVMAFIYCLAFKEINRQLHSDLYQANDKLIRLNTEYMSYRMNYVIALPKVVTKVVTSDKIFDTQTKQLLALAMNNSNPNEARNAAMQVCKRLSQRN